MVQAPSKVAFARQAKELKGRSSRHQGGGKIYRKVGLSSSHDVLCLDKDADWTMLASKAGDYLKEDCDKRRGGRVQLGVCSGPHRQWNLHATCMHDGEIRPADLVVMGAIASSDLAQIWWR